MITQPRFFRATGACVASCAKCGQVASCDATVSNRGELIFLCGECSEKANTVETGKGLKELSDAAGLSWPPEEFR